MKNYCINLKKRTDLEASAKAEFARYEMEVDFIEAIDGSKIPTNEHGLIGPYQALNQVIINILENEKGNVRIFEGDILFTENPTVFRYPEDWGVFRLFYCWPLQLHTEWHQHRNIW